MLSKMVFPLVKRDITSRKPSRYKNAANIQIFIYGVPLSYTGLACKRKILSHFKCIFLLLQNIHGFVDSFVQLHGGEKSTNIASKAC